MPDYRRYRIAGGCYFFTVNLLEGSPNVLLVRQSDFLHQAVHRVKQVRPFCIDAFVDYIYYNPVKHGYVTRVANWPYSTFQRCAEYLSRGLERNGCRG